jgi:DNA replication and repair protein RecF
VTVQSQGRDLRVFGSQGEQRLAVLSLLLAEADALTELHGVPPLVLLDDVLSELDAGRRRALAQRIGAIGQSVVTATGADALPVEPAQLIEVTPGHASAS